MKNKLLFAGSFALSTTVLILIGVQKGILNLQFAFLAGSLSLGVVLWIQRNRFIRDLTKLAGAALAGNSNGANGEEFIRTHLEQMGRLTKDMKLAISGINEIGQDKFPELLAGIQDNQIKMSLESAHHKITALRKKERQNNWVTQGIAAIAELKQKENDLEKYSTMVVSTVVKYLNANQGKLFLLKGEGEDAYFELTATYAFGKKRFVEQRINPGEGLIGQLFYEKTVVHITDVPSNYVKITSGLGEALPRSICIVPLLSEDKIYGALEVASFARFTDIEIEYLKKIGENVAYNLSTIAAHSDTEKLLEESRAMSEDLQSQEEELRQNMEELTATQEQMQRKQREIDSVLSSLSILELDLDGNVVDANPVFLSITGYKQADIERRPYKNFIPRTGNDLTQFDMMWSSILSGKSFSGEFRILNAAKKDLWMMGNLTPILNESGSPYKVMITSLFITQDKQKMTELQEIVTAVKNCFPMVELHHDMTFRSPNDLFLSELGIKRLELRNYLPKQVLVNGSFKRMEAYVGGNTNRIENTQLDIQNKSGEVKTFETSLIRFNDQQKTLILFRNMHKSLVEH